MGRHTKPARVDWQLQLLLVFFVLSPLMHFCFVSFLFPAFHFVSFPWLVPPISIIHNWNQSSRQCLAGDSELRSPGSLCRMRHVNERTMGDSTSIPAAAYYYSGHAASASAAGARSRCALCVPISIAGWRMEQDVCLTRRRPDSKVSKK